MNETCRSKNESNEEGGNNTGSTDAETFTVLETAIAWWEWQPESCPMQLVLLEECKILQAQNVVQKWCREKQTIIFINIFLKNFYFIKNIQYYIFLYTIIKPVPKET